jgi:metallophosphoesterase superfamily enzyme
VARVVSKSGGLRRRCFASDGNRCVMPAFGAYAGGLNIRDAAFAPLFPAGVTSAHVLGRSAVYGVGPAHCRPD